MKRIAVLTSGGDAPGMNAAIRSIVRTAIDRDWEVLGVRHGYAGLMAGDYWAMGRRDVGGIMQHGGTILGSARSQEFRTEEGQREALAKLRNAGCDALIVIGGNGSQTGTHALSRLGFPVVGVASTIDNDLYGSEITIGVDTALNISLEAIDRLKVTASSHQRGFLLEVMGRDCGYLALMAGIAGGAEAIVIPEYEMEPEAVANAVRDAYDRGKPHAIVVVAEGARYNTERLAHFFRENRGKHGFDMRTTVLGYAQRGGAPTYADRMLGTRLGAAAVDALADGRCGVLVGIRHGMVATTPLAEVVQTRKPLDESLVALGNVLAK
ncbi:MAG TPA: ATP-dependent 6-phosphofructokinase [Bryobacteraceae bacterium]|nr:ATP-dependent 6-phosphofructokinase [Bryobacteraceae bacterium]